MNLTDGIKTYGFATAMALVLLVTAYFHILSPPEGVENLSGKISSADSKMRRIQANPEKFLPAHANPEVTKTIAAKQKTLEVFDAQQVENDKFFERFFSTIAKKYATEPGSKGTFATFESDFNQALKSAMDELVLRLGKERLNAEVFKSLQQALDTEKAKAISAARGEIPKQVAAVRHVQKCYWIIEAICQIIANDEAGNLPISIEVFGTPVLFDQKKSQGGSLIYEVPKAGDNKNKPSTYLTWKTQIEVLIDQGDIPAFLQRLRQGLPPGTGNEAERGSRHVMLTPTATTFGHLPQKELNAYFANKQLDGMPLPKYLEQQGIIPTRVPGNDEKAPEGEGGRVWSTEIARMVLGAMEIRTDSQEHYNKCVKILSDIRYPVKLQVTLVVHDFNASSKKSPKPSSRKRRG